MSWYKGAPNKSKRECCFAGATLLRSNSSEDIKQVAMISNWIMSQRTAKFMLYSTYETTAALIFFSELNLSSIFNQKPLLKINNSKVLLPAQVNNLTEPIWSIEVVEGRVLLEVTKFKTESWGNFAQNAPISISFSKDNQLVRDNLFHLAESFDLKIKLDNGYQEGDLVQVRLPACLSRLVGGGQVKQFEVDFQGQNEITIPLVATGNTLSPISNEIANQHWPIALRNMYDENRANSLTDLSVKVLSAV